MIRTKKGQAAFGLVGVVGLAGAVSAVAGSATFDFTTDPSATIEIKGNGVNDQPWRDSGGNPGGFLALTYAINSSFSAFQFPDIDNGKIVTAFNFKADLRVGNSVGDRAADGFSVSFARSNDPVITGDLGNMGNFAGTIAEGGTTTGIAVCFDTWSGNTLPDGGDIEGIIVRVDNKTVNKTALATRHGACEDATSLQTGPRDAQYWTDGGDPKDPAAWKTLCWQPLEIDLTTDSKLTVSWKKRKILDAVQTAFFPSAGSIVLAGRTGNANEHTHFDNIVLTTTASDKDTVAPTAPTNGKVDEAGARHVKISWGAATDNSGRVAYRLTKDGNALGGLQTDLSYTDFDVAPGKTYKYEVWATDVSDNASTKLTINATTIAEIDSPGFLLARVYRTDSDGTAFGGASQDSMDTVLGSSKYPNSPDSVYYVNGLQFGEPNFGDTYGENHMVAISTVLTAPETASYRFFIRSDDASRLYINKTSATIPTAGTDSPIAQENGCCGGFEEPGAGDNGDGTFPTSEPVALTAGKQYGVLFLVKEGGGGDWGQVGWRKEGTSDAVQAITGPILTGKGDPIGAAINFTTNPADTTAFANQSVTLTAAASVTSPFGKTPYYQWYHDGKIVPGATSATLSIPVTAVSDSGKYALEVGTVGLTKRSSEATLTINADTKAPVITGADGAGGWILVNFDEPVKAGTGTFTVSGGVTVSGTSQAGAKAIALSVSDLTSETSYTVTPTGVQDNAGNSVAAGSTVTFKAWKFVPGVVRVEHWDGLSDTSLGNVKNVRLTAAPSVDYTTNVFESFVNRAESYGTVISTVIKPTTTGDYVFYLSSDDNSELWLSTDENPANVKRIATETGWSNPRIWLNTGDGSDNGGGSAATKRSDQYTSTQWPTGNKITLTANKRYYLEMIHQEGGGGDDAAAAIKLASAADPANGDSPVTGSIVFGSYYKPAASAAPTLTSARDGNNLKITYTGTLQSAASVSGPWTDVAGATSPYTATSTGAGTFYRAKQ